MLQYEYILINMAFCFFQLPALEHVRIKWVLHVETEGLVNSFPTSMSQWNAGSLVSSCFSLHPRESILSLLIFLPLSSSSYLGPFLEPQLLALCPELTSVLKDKVTAKFQLIFLSSFFFFWNFLLCFGCFRFVPILKSKFLSENFNFFTWFW